MKEKKKRFVSCAARKPHQNANEKHQHDSLQGLRSAMRNFDKRGQSRDTQQQSSKLRGKTEKCYTQRDISCERSSYTPIHYSVDTIDTLRLQEKTVTLMALHRICLRSAEERFWNTFACSAANPDRTAEKIKSTISTQRDVRCTFTAVLGGCENDPIQLLSTRRTASEQRGRSFASMNFNQHAERGKHCVTTSI